MRGEERAALPGFVLVVGEPVIGFAHVLDLAAVGTSGLHLEQISVRPSAARAGVGRMLLRAAMGAVLDRGQDWLTLMTFGDIPWNGPWYAREGFTEIGASDSVHWSRLTPLRETETREGLDRIARRAAMVCALADEPEPRPAVSVIPIRERGGELEVFVQHRALTMDFAPGAVVFPGGRVDPEDATTAYCSGIAVAQACAVREVREETGASIDPGALIPWDRWITPIRYPRRFDVEFFMLPVEGGEEFTHLTGEATHSEWVGVERLVRDVESGAASMVPPTRTIIDELSALGSLDAVSALHPVVAAVHHDLAPPRPRSTPISKAGR